MRRPEEPRRRAPQRRVKPRHRRRRPETPVSHQPAARPRRRPAQPRLPLRPDRIRPIRTRQASNLLRRIRIIRTRTPITRAQIQILRGRPRIRARQIPVLPTQAPIPALRIRVPIQVRATQVRITQVLRTQLLRIRRQGIRLPARRRRVGVAHRRSKRQGAPLQRFQIAGPRGPHFLSLLLLGLQC